MRKALITAAVLSAAFACSATASYKQAKSIVYAVFPSQTQTLMLEILACETGFKYNSNAYNRSGATGFFQILSSHNGETYSYNGRTVTIVSSRLYEPWYNVEVAYVMSRGGTNLAPWYSSRYCWGLIQILA